MHTDKKNTLIWATLLLAISGCQSGAGSTSWKWWGAQKDQSVSPSELAGSPYDGVKLPSTQVEIPKVTGTQPETKKKSLATIPPGTATSNPYAVTDTQSTTKQSATNQAVKNGAPTYPSTPYPRTPYANPRASTAEGIARAPVSNAPNQTASAGPKKSRYPTTDLATGSPQSRYPNTGFGSAPPSSPSQPLAQAPQAPTTGGYGVNAAVAGNKGFNAAPPGMGSRYSSNENSFPGPTANAAKNVVPPTSLNSVNGPGVASQNPIGPRYATVPSGPDSSRYDVKPSPVPAAATQPPAHASPSYATASVGVGGQKIANQQAGRYPQAIVPTTSGSSVTQQVDFTPFKPGSTRRYEPDAGNSATTTPVGANNYQQPGVPYNPPAKEFP